jgi:hypothetical protein
MWYFKDPIVDLAASLALLALLTAIASYAIVKVRSRAKEEDPTGIELLSKFRDVHSQGGLSDAEFRTIKTRLADRVVDGLKDKEERG